MSISAKGHALDTIYIESVSGDEAVPKPSDDLAHQGALILEEERHLGLAASVKLFKRPLLICSVSFTAAMIFGYDSIANGASIAMPSFLLYFGAKGPTGLYIPSIWASLWTSFSLVGQAIGAFAVGFIMDRYGRKWTASSSSAITIVGTALQYTAHSRGLLLAGKVINGVGIGAAMAVATTYASEVAPFRLRGPVQQALVLFYVFMLGVGLTVVRLFAPDIKEQAFRNVFAIQWAVGGLAIIAFALAPESPNYLITRGRIDQARKSMRTIYGSSASSVDARLALLVKIIREEQVNKELHAGSYIECFHKANLRRTLTVVFIYTAVRWAGAALLAQSIYFLIIAGLQPIHAFDVSIGGFGLSILIIISTWFVGTKLRRRATFLSGVVINFFFMMIIAVLYYIKGIGALWGIAILMNVLISLQTSLIQAMGFPIAAELSSLKLRSKTLSIGIISQAIISWLMAFVTPYMYNVDSGDLGARTGFIYMAISAILIVIAWYYVPETAGMTVLDIDHAYDQKVPARRFKAGMGSLERSSEGEGDHDVNV